MNKMCFVLSVEFSLQFLFSSRRLDDDVAWYFPLFFFILKAFFSLKKIFLGNTYLVFIGNSQLEYKMTVKTIAWKWKTFALYYEMIRDYWSPHIKNSVETPAAVNCSVKIQLKSKK